MSRRVGRSAGWSGVGTVAELHRYPVKSMVGERLDVAEVERRGVVGDRRWAVTDLDGKLGSGKTTTRFRRMDGLLDLVAAHAGDAPVVTFPDGRRFEGPGEAVDEALSEHVGRTVRLQEEDRIAHIDEGPLHLLTTASLAEIALHHGDPVPPARLRPNLVIAVTDTAGFVEDGWVGRRLTLGDEVILAVTGRMPRCVMVDAGQRDLPPDEGVLRTIGAVNDACLGAVADVVTTGLVRVGDRVTLLP